MEGRLIGWQVGGAPNTMCAGRAVWASGPGERRGRPAAQVGLFSLPGQFKLLGSPVFEVAGHRRTNHAHRWRGGDGGERDPKTGGAKARYDLP